MSLSLSSPLSLYSIPVVWFVGFYPNVLKALLVKRSVGSFNNIHPRGNVARLHEKKVSPEIAAKAARLEAAHLNGNEAFPLWTAAVIVGNFAKVDSQTLNTLALSYIVLRILYNTIYANQNSPLQGSLRSLVWNAGISIPFYILVKAANIVRLGQ